MGLFDRRKKPPGPDALTWEAVARARAVPGVAGAEATDADTVVLTWAEHPGTSTLSLAGVREAWSKASGFARIELMDEVVAGLAPPADTGTAPGIGPAHAPPVDTAAPAPTDAPGDAWTEARTRLAIRVGPPTTGTVGWPVVAGLEAAVVLDGVDGPPVSDADLAAWGADREQARTAALAALAAADPELDPVGPGQPAWVPTVPSAHPPIWLAAPARLLAAAGLSEAVALAPTPTELVLVDPSATDLLASVLAGTRAILRDAAEVLFSAPLLVRPDGVEEWRPAVGHPCAELVAELRGA